MTPYAIAQAAREFAGQDVAIRTAAGQVKRGRVDALLTHPVVVLDGQAYSVAVLDAIAADAESLP
jgi:hypothetical protein